MLSRKALKLFVGEAMDREEPKLLLSAKSRMMGGGAPDDLTADAACAGTVCAGACRAVR